MEGIDEHWRLCDEYTVTQAALLVVGWSPSGRSYIEREPECNWPEGYQAVKLAIANGLRSKKITGRIVELQRLDDPGNGIFVGIKDSVDVTASVVDASSLKE